MDRILDPMTTPSRRPKGFTLLEVLVALAILAIALISIFKLQGQTLRMSAKARFLTVAPHLAQAKLAEIETQDFDKIADGSGAFSGEQSDYDWNVDVEEIPTDLIADNNYHLIRINITITQTDGDSYQLRTYRFYGE
jgi:general secretion pathway protein I